MKKHGFTLLELLVVIAIIGVLAALLFSALRDTRASGHAAQCLQNLREIAAANLQYTREHEGRFCYAQQKNNNIRWHGEREGTKEPFDPTKGPLAPYLGRNGEVKKCPAFQPGVPASESFENGTGGYGYNAVYVGGSPANKWLGELLSNIPNPGRTVMFTDSALSKREGLQEYAYAEPPQWVTPTGRLAGALSPSVHFRHTGKAHVAWCDGHVTAESPSRLGGKNYYGGDDAKSAIGWFGPEKNNGWWNPAFREEN